MLLIILSVCWGFLEVNFFLNQSLLQKTITQTKKSRKGRVEWKESYIVARLFAQMLRILMKIMFVSQIILFQETLEFQNVISICYGWQQATHTSSKYHVFHSRVVTPTIADTFFFHVVKLYVLNQIQGFQLLSNELIYVFTLCINMKVHVGRIQAFHQPLICGNFDLKL